jgi:hypothetical protein
MENSYSQALRTPLIMVGGSGKSTFTIVRSLNDTSTQAMLANWTVNGIAATVLDVAYPGSERGGLPGIVTGNPLLNYIAENGAGSGQNFNTFQSSSAGYLTLPVYGSSRSSIFTFETPVSFPAQHTLYWALPAPTNVAVTGPTSGGSLPKQLLTFEVTANGVDGGESALSAPSPTSCTPRAGNQTCTITWDPVVGAVSYNVYQVQDGGIMGTSTCQNLTVLTCTADYKYGGGHSAPSASAAGSTTVMNNQIITPQIVLSGPLSGAVSFAATLKGSFSASRNDTLPDASGTVSLAADYACGATSRCSATPVNGARTFYGDATLTSGSPSTVTITGFSPPFTSTSTFECTASDNTSQSALKVSKVSTTGITITGPNTVTDSVSYICKGN